MSIFTRFFSKKRHLTKDERSEIITALAQSPTGTGQRILISLGKACRKKLAMLPAKGGKND